MIKSEAKLEHNTCEAKAPENKNPLLVLVDKASKTLEDRGDYCERDVRSIEVTWRQFLSYCESNGFNQYLPEYTDNFLEHLKIQPMLLKPSTVKRKAGHMKILDLCYRDVAWLKGALNPKTNLAEDFMNFISSQDEFLKKRQYSEVSCKTIHEQTYIFLSFFQKEGIDKLSEITADHISSCVLTLTGHAKSTLRGELSRLRQILHNAYLLNYTEIDSSIYVPSYNLGQPQSTVKIWESKEISKVLEAVDRSNPKGLRDSAFIIIAAELGLRSKDITNIKLDDIDWENCSISIIQSKTQKANVLPLNEKTGSAIIDYLRVRPETDCEYLFVNLNPPYGRMKSFYSSFHRYVQRSGVSIPIDAHYGLHSLRATIATRLLNAGVDPDTIVAILGHSDRESLHNYIRLDIEHLRECALSFEGGEFV